MRVLQMVEALKVTKCKAMTWSRLLILDPMIFLPQPNRLAVPRVMSRSAMVTMVYETHDRKPFAKR